MSIKGVKQLKQLIVRYSDYDGSSRGMIDWIRTKLVDFATNNPSLIITTEIKRNKHPFLKGIYLNGNDKVICVKNQDSNVIHNYALFLRNQIGRKMAEGYNKPKMTNKPSIQGEWHERLDLIDLKFNVQSKY
mmetsp:Transcript_19297/g.17529  ORF Transcript_19297/g.17529 Transcript_19297/m.17529 type:complete len:132 (-) Transcript_19297:21-416(-)